MSDSIVCSGYLTKSPTSGGRGRWKLRWVELVDDRKEEGGYLRLEYFNTEKKKKTALGVISLETCVGIRELSGEDHSFSFSFLFKDRSDLVLSSLSEKDIHRWIFAAKSCDIPILVAISVPSTLTSANSACALEDSSVCSIKQEVDWKTRELPPSPPSSPKLGYKKSIHPYSAVLYGDDEDMYKPIGGHYYSRANMDKRLSQPAISMEKPLSLLVEPSPNLVALKTQLKNLKPVSRKKLKFSTELVAGAFGPVYEATLGKQVVAVKKLELTRSEEEEMVFLREAFIISQFNHPNIVKVLGVVMEGQRMAVLELLSTITLQDHLTSLYKSGKVEGSELVSFSCEVALGMKHMHTMGYIHKRLRASHVLMTSDLKHCKIAGFSESASKTDLMSTTSKDKLTPNSNELWMAIEVVKKLQFSYKSDIWSYGILLYEIWSVGQFPYKDFTVGMLVDFLNELQCMAPPPGCPQAIYKTMLQCLSHKPSSRPPWQAILSTLQAPNLVLTIQDGGHGKKLSKLPSESLVLGSRKSNCTKHLHESLQKEYTESQKADLEKVLKTLSKSTAPARNGKGIRNFLGRKFSKAEVDDKPVQIEGNAAYNALSAEGTVSMEKNAAYSLAPQLCDALSVYEDYVVSDAEMGIVRDDSNPHPFNRKTRQRTRRVKGLKSSVSSESLTIYEDMELDLTHASQAAKASTLPGNDKGRPTSSFLSLDIRKMFGRTANEKRERSNTEVSPKPKK